MVAEAPTFADLAPTIGRLLTFRVPVAHNAPFDMGFLHAEASRAGLHVQGQVQPLCTMQTAPTYLRGLQRLRLIDCTRAAGLERFDAHEGGADALATARLLGVYLARGAGRSREFRAALAACRATRWQASGPPVTGMTRAQGRAAAAEIEKERLRQRREAVDVLSGTRRWPELDGLDGAMSAYLDVVDRALEDRFIVCREREEMKEAAARLGLSKDAVATAHRLYLATLAAAAVVDGRVLPRARADMETAAKELRLRQAGMTRLMVGAQSAHLRGGEPIVRVVRDRLAARSRVLLDSGLVTPRDVLEQRMRACGLVPAATARGKLALFVCDLDDVTAERVCRLRSQGVRVATEQVFLTMLTDLERSPTSNSRLEDAPNPPDSLPSRP
jgi:DNA polymerase-3 subunit epsilon